MYNRYIRNDTGVYERVPVEESRQPEEPRAAPRNERSAAPPPPPPSPPPSPPPYWGSHTEKGGRGKGFFSDILSKLKLDEIDTGDLLLLVILFLLFKDGEDEELLIALGLLLIL